MDTMENSRTELTEEKVEMSMISFRLPMKKRRQVEQIAKRNGRKLEWLYNAGVDMLLEACERYGKL